VNPKSHPPKHPLNPYTPVNPLEKVANFLRLRGRLEAPKFSFLNLGLLAYVGQQEALAQVQTGNIKVRACECGGVFGCEGVGWGGAGGK
jgi:hypothetical protein